jgi:hypothetical protein
MAADISIASQVAPSSQQLTTLYETSLDATVISSIIVCNRGNTNTTFRISVAIAGESNDSKQYLYYDHPINGNTTFIATIGITLNETDVIRVYAGNGNLSFSVFGVV